MQEKIKKLHDLKIEYKKAGSTRAEDDGKGIWSYSKAAKAAALHYAYISAYPKPL